MAKRIQRETDNKNIKKYNDFKGVKFFALKDNYNVIVFLFADVNN